MPYAEIYFKEGKKRIDVEIRRPEEIENCEIDKIVILHLRNNDEYTGFFKGINEDENGDQEICLQALDSDKMIGLKVDWLTLYWQQI
jgi:hypothetical protein